MLSHLSLSEKINFIATNRLPRKAASKLMGKLASIEQPTLAKAMVRVWQHFDSELDLSESDVDINAFRSLKDCFTRPIKQERRPIARQPGTIISPADAIIGAHGSIEDGMLLQAKGFPYTLQELLNDDELASKYRRGYFVTLRLKASFYHRFHAPIDGQIFSVNFIHGDMWNVNPVAVKTIDKLYCLNERAVIEVQNYTENLNCCLVPVAAILVASLKVHCIDGELNQDYTGPKVIPCNQSVNKGQELGYFEHGSTIVLLTSNDLSLNPTLATGDRVNVGQVLLAPTNRSKL